MSSKADKNHLTLKQKAELCEMSMKPNFNKEKICKDYGIHRTTLNRILSDYTNQSKITTFFK